MNQKTREKAFNQVVNVPVDDRQVDEINNRDYSMKPLDKMSSYFESLRAKNKKIEKNEFFGYILWAQRMRIDKFQEIYDPSTDFYKEILNASNVTKVKPGSMFISYRVHVPEISGMLPFPNFSFWIKSEKLKDDAAMSDDEQKIEKMLKEAEGLVKKSIPEVLKVDLFPRMYSYTETSDIPYMGQFCKVKVADSLPTKGTGIVLEVYEETVEDLGVTAQ